MRDYKENGESHVSDPQTQGNELVDAIEEALDDWVADDAIQAYRNKGYVVVEEETLVEQMSVMVAIAMREASE